MGRSPSEEKMSPTLQKLKELQHLRANLRRNRQRRQAYEPQGQKKPDSGQKAGQETSCIVNHQRAYQKIKQQGNSEYGILKRAKHQKAIQNDCLGNVHLKKEKPDFKYEVDKTKIFSRGWVMKSEFLIKDVLQRRYHLQGIKSASVMRKANSKYNQGIIQFRNQDFASLAMSKANRIKSYMNLTDFSFLKKRVCGQKLNNLRQSQLKDCMPDQQKTPKLEMKSQKPQYQEKQFQRHQKYQNNKKPYYSELRKSSKTKSVQDEKSEKYDSPKSQKSFQSDRRLRSKNSPNRQGSEKWFLSAKALQSNTPEKIGKKIKKRY